MEEKVRETIMNRVRVLRIIEYVGDREWVERTVSKSIHGKRTYKDNTITAVTVNEYPEVLLNQQEDKSDRPAQDAL